MRKIIIKSLKELEQFKRDPGSVQFYRGESKSFDTPMMSGIYRNTQGISLNELKRRETEYFNLFKQKVDSKDIIVQDPFPNQLEFYKEWFWLFQAQHLGLKTRLIDFTVDMEIALLFAVNQWKDDNENGHFWIFHCPPEIKIVERRYGEVYNTSPMEMDKSYMINPVQFQSEVDFIGKRRMVRQSGRFFVQSTEDGFTPIYNQERFKNNFRHLEIDAKSKKTIREELAESCCLSEWIYYKHDCFVENEIKSINEIDGSSLNILKI